MREEEILLKPKEAAKMLGVSTRTLSIWNKNGKIDCFKTVGKHKRFLLSEIERLRKEN